MSIILAASNSYPNFCLTVSEVCKQLSEHIQEKGYPLSIKIDVVSPMFYLTEKEMSKLQGPIGNYGSRGSMGPMTPNYVDSRRILPPKEQVISIQGKASSCVATLHCDRILKFKESKGANLSQSILPLVYSEVKDMQLMAMGWYKRPGFDAAYIAMKALIPNLEEKDFATYYPLRNYAPSDYNPELVEKRPFTIEQDCIHRLEEYIERGTKHWNVSLSCLDSDLEENMEVIKSFLTELSPELLP